MRASAAARPCSPRVVSEILHRLGPQLRETGTALVKSRRQFQRVVPVARIHEDRQNAPASPISQPAPICTRGRASHLATTGNTRPSCRSSCYERKTSKKREMRE